MEIKNRGLRMRVGVVVLAAVGLGLVATHRSNAPLAQSSEDLTSPGETAGLRPASSPSGKSKGAATESVSTAMPAVQGSGVRTITVTREMRLRQSTARLKFLDHCARAECPGFKTIEAHSYDLDISKQIARELEEYSELAPRSTEAENVARYFLVNGNDDVKEAALALMARAPITNANLHVVLTAMADTASAPLIKTFAHSEFAVACAKSENGTLCSSWVKDRMQRGGENVQKTLARYSLELTNEYTAPLFAKLERDEAHRDPFSLKYRYLRANNAEFGRMQRGG